MAFVPAPNIVQVELRATLAGQNIENRLMVDALEPVTETNLADITNLVSNWAQSTYFDHLPSAVVLREVVGTDLTTQNGQQHTIAPEGGIGGGLSGEPMPNEVTLCVSLRSGNRGRSARGRLYVLALEKVQVSGNNVSGTLAANFVADMEALIDVLTTAGYALVIVSYISNKVPRPGGPVYFPVTTAVVTDLVVDSMRRRKPGVGS